MTVAADLADPLAEGWRRPRPGASAFRSDAWAAFVLAAGTALSVSLSRGAGFYDESPVWLVALWVAGLTVPLAFRRRWPEAVAVIVAVVFSVGSMLGAVDLLFSNICLYLAIYTIGAWGRNRALARWVRLALVAGMFVWLFWALLVQANQATTLPELSRDGAFSPYAAWGLLQVLINLLYFGAAYYFGETAWQAARRSAALDARTHELGAERERVAAQAVALERVRIARELHDVVAHHVSVMGVQAGAARRILNRDSIAAEHTLAQIEQSARSAVEELGTMLVALRSEDATTAATGSADTTRFVASESTSTRGIEQLEQLADASRQAGLPVSVRVIGSVRPVPGTINLSVYRIAQEALTNARKHAGAGASVDLRLRYEADAVELEVADDGVGPRAGAGAHSGAGVASGTATTPGHGQRGMRERVAAVGGELQLGARPRGGYLVRARFPTPALPSPDDSPFDTSPDTSPETSPLERA
nr:sensor histidine kinase [Leifsonia psychrotolerans]